MTFMPFIFIKNAGSSRKIKIASRNGDPAFEDTREKYLKQIRRRKLILYGLPLVSISLFFATIIASFERTPLTGRWRAILLSPEEEEEIANQLAGEGWHNAVKEILVQDGSPKAIPQCDWRYQWVNETLRSLEASVPALVNKPVGNLPDGAPSPPPSDYPLLHRPRASEYLHYFSDLMSDTTKSQLVTVRAKPGPPYSLLVVDKPNMANAFSYGFGPNGAGGIVVYSGFLDDILSRSPSTAQTTFAKDARFTRFFHALFYRSRVKEHPMPTAEQTSELAVLLAHELSHLILAHHLESLSSTTVIIPGAISIVTDIVRVVIFPLTMLFGPFVNDALAQLGRVSSAELSRVGSDCNTMLQEIEADTVSARILAHAGYDAREAVKFWEARSAVSAKSTSDAPPQVSLHESRFRRALGSGHPIDEVRLSRLKDELARWDSTR